MYYVCERICIKYPTKQELKQSHKNVMLKKESLDKIRKAMPSDGYVRICEIIGDERSCDSLRMVLSDPKRNKKGKQDYVIDAAIKVADAYQAEIKIKEEKISKLPA